MVTKTLSRGRVPILLVIAILVAAMLRLYHLGQWSFWIDEAFTASNIETGGYFTVSRILTLLPINIFGPEDWSYRLVPALIGIITIPIFYYGVREILQSKTLALLSSLLLALSHWHILLSQEARYYTALQLFFMLSLFSFFLAVKTNHRRYYILGLVFLALAFLERGYALLLIPTFLVFVLIAIFMSFGIFKEGFSSRVLRTLGIIAGLAAALYVVYEVIHLASRGRFFIVGLYDRFLAPTPNVSAFSVPKNVFYNIGPLLFFLAVWGAIHVIRKRELPGLLVACGAFVPIIALMGIALFSRLYLHYVQVVLPFIVIMAAIGIYNIYQERRVIVLTVVILLSLPAFIINDYFDDLAYLWPQVRMPMLILLAAIGVLSLILVFLRNRHTLHLLTVLAVVVFVLELAVFSVLYYGPQQGYRTDWRTASQVVLQDFQEDEPVYTTLRPLADYYLGDSMAEEDIRYLGYVEDIPESAAVDLDTLFDDASALWIIEEPGVNMIWGDKFAAWAQTNCEVRRELDKQLNNSLSTLRVLYCQK